MVVVVEVGCFVLGVAERFGEVVFDPWILVGAMGKRERMSEEVEREFEEGGRCGK